MTPESWQHLRRLYEQALLLAESELEAFLRSAGNLEADLRQMLSADTTGFLDSPVIPPIDPATRLSLSQTLCDRFEITRFIAKGGMGEVYQAYDRLVGEEVALKVLQPWLAADESAIDIFRREVRRARSISSPYVCRVHDLFTHQLSSNEVVTFISMRLLRGETIASRIHRVGNFSRAEALPLLKQIAAGVDAAHRENIAHGDLKTANVILTEDRAGGVNANITDFGLARRFSGKVINAEASTGSWTPGGTPLWMAPEQVLGSPPEPSADIYAVGLIAYQMTTGRLPFEGETRKRSVYRRPAEENTSARLDNPRNAAVWDSALRQCLSRDPLERFDSATAFVESLDRAVSSTKRIKRLIPWTSAFILAAIVGLCFQYFRHGTVFEQANAKGSAIVVLPFRNIDGAPEYLSEGLTEELIQSLKRIPDVHVLGPQSSFFFRNSKEPPLGVARRLGARYALGGVLSQAQGRLLVSVRLEDALENKETWSTSRADLGRDVFSISRKIADVIAQRFNVMIKEPRPSFNASGTGTLKERDLYWLGRLYFRERTDQSVLRSVDFFRQAIAQDPNFALEYCGLADALFVVAERGLESPEEALSAAKAAAQKAVWLNSSLPEAWTALAQITSIYDHDLDKAEELFQRSLALDENSAPAWQWYSYQLAKERRFAEAVKAGEAAVSSDPFSLPANINLADVYFFSNLDDATVRQCRKLMEIAPDLFFDHLLTALVFAKKGLIGEALHEMEGVPDKRKDDPWTLRVWVEIYSRCGMHEQAQKAMSHLLTRYREGVVLPSYIATGYAAIGDKEKALSWLALAINRRDASASFVNAYPAFDWLRSDPRYSELMSQLGIRVEIR